MRPPTRGPAAAEMDVDMTPMIDVVFLLIIFFITVATLERMETGAKVKLPIAEQSNLEENPDTTRLTINLEKDGGAFVMGQKVTQDELRRLLQVEAGKSGDLGLVDEQGFSKRPVLIRGHKDLEYRHVQDLMQECQKVRIWKLSFAALLEPSPE